MKTNRTAGILAGMVLLGGVSAAQEAAPAGGPGHWAGRGGRGSAGGESWDRRPGEMTREMILSRMIGSGRAAEELGIGPEQAQKLRAGMQQIQEEEIDLQAEMQKLSLRQADLMASLLADRSLDAKEIMALVDEIGALKTRLAKMPVKRMLFLRDNLTADQIRKAHEMMKERAGRWRGREGDGAPGGTAPGAPGVRPERPAGGEGHDTPRVPPHGAGR
jgi:Spy/CpxP family protein refolding chaperone